MAQKAVLFISLGTVLLLHGCSGSRPFAPAALLAKISSEQAADTEELENKNNNVSILSNIKERKPSELTKEEMEMAKVAWKYFENNTQDTGLCNAVQGYPSVTLWDTASYMGGLVAAYELSVIQKQEFNMRMTKLLGALNKLEFFRNELPNKVYHTQSGIKVNYRNEAGEVGFSAVDLGRLLIWLAIIKEGYPVHASAVDNFVLKFNFSNVVDASGTMFCASVSDDKVSYLQEGRLGYEEYAAKGFQLWGIDTSRASKIEPYQTIPLYGIELPYDSRDPRELVAHNYVVTESYVLDAIELGWDMTNDRTSPADVYTDPQMLDFGRRIFAIQEARYKDTGILTARTEHQLEKDPYFVYDTIYSDGYAWNTITHDGSNAPQFAAVALKGAFGIWAVWDMPYSQTLLESIGHLNDPEKGFYEGLYENGSGPISIFTANNNGIILECLLYKAKGKILKFGTSTASSLWDKTIQDCPPSAREKGQCMRKK